MSDTIVIDIWSSGHGEYRAQVIDRPGAFSVGKNPDEAIGKLMRSHHELFNVRIILPDESKSG